MQQTVGWKPERSQRDSENKPQVSFRDTRLACDSIDQDQIQGSFRGHSEKL